MFDLARRVDAVWEAKWSSTTPLGFVLRAQHPDRWVRFHALPDSKRYPETAEEYATVLERHDAVLRELGASGEIFVLWPVFPSVPASNDVLRDGVFWRTVESDYLAEPAQIHVGSLAFPSTGLDGLLRAVADDAAELTLGPDHLDWLYHPYDGGADVIAPSPAERDSLRRKFENWLPDGPSGL